MGDLVETYIELIVAMDDMDFGSKISVAINNRRANRIRKIAATIDQRYPELKSKFFSLIDSQNSKVKIWAAHHISEVMNFDEH